MKFLTILSSFLVTVSSINIACNFGDELFNGWKKRYSCAVVKYVTDGSSKAVETVTGSHLNSSYSHENVTQFFAKGLKIEQFPERLGSHFPNLKVIRIAMCDLSILYKSSLVKLEILEFLDLSGNRLENLKSDVFENTPNLIELWLNKNRLQFVGSQILNPLKNLKVVNFGANTCVGSNARHSSEDLERLKIELRLKCSDTSMYDLMKKMNNIETKIENILNEIVKLYQEMLESKKLFRPVDFHD